MNCSIPRQFRLWISLWWKFGSSRTAWFQPVLSRAERASPQSFLVCLSEPFPCLRLHLWIRSLSHPLYELRPSTFWFLPPASDCEISIIHWHPHFPSFFLAYSHSTSPFWPVKCPSFPIFSPWKSTALGPQPPCAPWPGRTEPTARHRPPWVTDGFRMGVGWVLDEDFTKNSGSTMRWYNEKCVETWMKNEWKMNEHVGLPSALIR